MLRSSWNCGIWFRFGQVLPDGSLPDLWQISKCWCVTRLWVWQFVTFEWKLKDLNRLHMQHIRISHASVQRAVGHCSLPFATVISLKFRLWIRRYPRSLLRWFQTSGFWPFFSNKKVVTTGCCNNRVLFQVETFVMKVNAGLELDSWIAD